MALAAGVARHCQRWRAKKNPAGTGLQPIQQAEEFFFVQACLSDHQAKHAPVVGSIVFINRNFQEPTMVVAYPLNVRCSVLLPGPEAKLLEYGSELFL